ncbi:hypothetical protein [Ureibacillus aquaedulcis]|uniref:Uncharacterized protein n=1 Tax=Ureibacillus aquaedulcis TaxID=3058421 RepID=A0ABT8GP96_9BACL|nr:hypothetical protein [Ureibacillus sp. BA0131]MDN4492731.1 hypothetical protein [Ureibacillus sp. BA0131]
MEKRKYNNNRQDQKNNRAEFAEELDFNRNQNNEEFAEEANFSRNRNNRNQDDDNCEGC